MVPPVEKTATVGRAAMFILFSFLFVPWQGGD
jgi:hypothetical protein